MYIYIDIHMYSMSIHIQYIQPPNPWPKCRGEAVSFGRSKAFLVRCSKHPQKLTIHKMCHPENLGKMIPTFDYVIYFQGVGGSKPPKQRPIWWKRLISFGFLLTEILHSNHFFGGAENF